MVYTLDKADKLCGVTYIDWSKTYSKIPKATCKTIKQKCSSGGYYDDAVELNCEELKKLIHGEDKPKEKTPNEDTSRDENHPNHVDDNSTVGKEEFSILKLMPKVEGTFSNVGHYENGIVSSVTEQRPEQKEAFERKVITTLKSKLPDGAVVEAVLGEPYYKHDSMYIPDKTNDTLNVRVTLNGKVYEQEYNVPHIEELVADIGDHL